MPRAGLEGRSTISSAEVGESRDGGEQYDEREHDIFDTLARRAMRAGRAAFRAGDIARHAALPLAISGKT